MLRFIKMISVLILCAVLCAGCENTPDTGLSDDGKLLIYASFYPMYDLALKAVGDLAEVRIMIPDGTEPHDWEPSPQDIIGLEQADIFVYSGGGLEAWVDSVVPRIKNEKLLVVEALPDLGLIEGDPHTWLDPALAKDQFTAISDAVISLDPDNSDKYTEYRINILEEFDKLDAEYAELSVLPNKRIIVTHGAFGYLCAAYGLEQISIAPAFSEDEPSPARMAEIVSLACENGIGYIFYDEISSSKLAQSVAGEIDGRILPLSTLEGLSSEERENGEDYFSVMRKNLASLKEALS